MKLNRLQLKKKLLSLIPVVTKLFSLFDIRNPMNTCSVLVKSKVTEFEDKDHFFLYQLLKSFGLPDCWLKPIFNIECPHFEIEDDFLLIKFLIYGAALSKSQVVLGRLGAHFGNRCLILVFEAFRF